MLKRVELLDHGRVQNEEVCAINQNMEYCRKDQLPVTPGEQTLTGGTETMNGGKGSLGQC